MLSEAHGILFHAPENVIREFPQFPAVHTYEDLKREFLQGFQPFAEPVAAPPMRRPAERGLFLPGTLSRPFPSRVSSSTRTLSRVS